MKPAVLLILDGLGYRKAKKNNALANAKTPCLNELEKNGFSVLNASGKSVGLPANYMGNSEVGHITIGAGRRQQNALEIVNKSIAKKTFFQNPALTRAIQNAKRHNTAVHLMGLISKNGVHAHENHLFALLKLCRQLKQKKVWIHFFSDGRDDSPKTALQYLKRLNRQIKKNKVGTIATVCGRYYAMDRDKHWNRTWRAFECIANAQGKKFLSAKKAIEDAYQNGGTDEFIEPSVISDYGGILPNDSVIFFNFRLDRARQLSHLFLDRHFSKVKRAKPPVFFAAFFAYYPKIPCAVAFDEPKIKNGLGETISKNKLRQLRVGETEKFAHVTYFFNGQAEKPFLNEKRILIPSHRVATHDKAPAMKSREIASAVCLALQKNAADLIIANFANPDMLGHTGNFEKTIQGIQIMDAQIQKIKKAVVKQKGALLVAADHGNCEIMSPKNGGRKKNHTTNPVRLFLWTPTGEKLQKKGELADIAPTILDLFSIPKPREMTGHSLLQKNRQNRV